MYRTNSWRIKQNIALNKFTRTSNIILSVALKESVNSLAWPLNLTMPFLISLQYSTSLNNFVRIIEEVALESIWKFLNKTLSKRDPFGVPSRIYYTCRRLALPFPLISDREFFHTTGMSLLHNCSGQAATGIHILSIIYWIIFIITAITIIVKESFLISHPKYVYYCRYHQCLWAEP